MSDVIGWFVVVFIVGLIALAFKAQQCESKSISFPEHEFSITGGCMVKHNGRWLPLENIRGFE